jgi:hypothetical protein
MALRDPQMSEFDPSTLKPVDTPSTLPLDATSGDSGDKRTIVQTPMQGPDGQMYVKQVVMQHGEPVGAASYLRQADDGSTIRYQPNGDGSFMEGKFEKRSFGEAIFKDKKLMGFFALAGAGALAAGAMGATGTAGLTAGTGATPGTAGAVTSAAGAGGSVAPAAGAIAGSQAAAGAGGMTAEQIAALEAGDVAVGGGGVASNTVAATAAPAVAAAPTALAPASSYFDRLFNMSSGSGQLIGGLISGIGSGIAGHEQTEAALQARREDREFEAAEAEKARQWKARNFGADKMATIDWVTPRATQPDLKPPTLKDEAPQASMAQGIIAKARSGNRTY